MTNNRAGAADAHVGYDFDGIIASERGLFLTLARFLGLPAFIRCAQRHSRCLRRPASGFIISCRPESERVQTQQWLRKHSIKLPLILCPSAKEKASYINLLRLTRFLENDASVASELRARCSSAEIILTGQVRGRP